MVLENGLVVITGSFVVTLCQRKLCQAYMGGGVTGLELQRVIESLQSIIPLARRQIDPAQYVVGSHFA